MTRTGLFILMLPMLLTACGDQGQVLVYEVQPTVAYDWPSTEPTTGQAGAMVWQVPAGWLAVEDLAEELDADYRFEGATQELPGRMTISNISGNGGGLEANLARWRGQVYALQTRGPVPGETVSQPIQLTPLIFARQVKIPGQYQGPYTPSAMMVTIVTIADQTGRPIITWYLKLTGDQATLDAAEEDYNALVRSFQFDPELIQRLRAMDTDGPESSSDAGPDAPPAIAPRPGDRP